MRLEKIMVVGAEIPERLKEVLSATTSKVLHVPNGYLAITQAQREMFDAAILVSTGEEMDLAETIFNLNDISRTMELIILSDQSHPVNSAIPKETLACLVSSATVMTTRDLANRLTWP